MTTAAPTAEQQVAAACRAAELTPVQTEVALLHLVDGLNASQIRLKLHLPRVADARRLVLQAIAKLQFTPGFWDAAREFEREIIPCSLNREDNEHRPADLRGVTPDRSSQRFQGAPMVSREDVRQDSWSAARMWANNLRNGPVAAASA